MDIEALIAGLSQRQAYPHAVERVEVRQTHISLVFLAGRFAYKVKKPVALGFLDFSTLTKRRHYCDEEVRLNRRLAPRVYRGVLPITTDADRLQVGGSGEPVEWTVQMERLPDQASLEWRLRHEAIDLAEFAALAGRIAEFHATAERGENIASYAHFEAVARNLRENLQQARPDVGGTLSSAVYARLTAATEEALARARPLIEQRAVQDACDTHGDLHLDHVYHFPEKTPPDDWVIVDCIEFNERFRYADPVADMAFLVMDLAYHNRRDLAQAFADAYFEARGDASGRELVPLYVSYRASVRGKVEGMKASEPEVPKAERAAAAERARAYWLLALAELEPPSRRPCLVLVGGLPGTGKSTLARGLAQTAGFHIVRSDVVRKELAAASADTGSGAVGEALYSPEWTEQTYAECQRRADLGLFEGERIIIDATFASERRRQDFFALAARRAVSGILLLCEANPDVVARRLASRKDDVSDADWNVYREAAARWEAAARPQVAVVNTSGSSASALEQALHVLARSGLYTP